MCHRGLWLCGCGIQRDMWDGATPCLAEEPFMRRASARGRPQDKGALPSARAPRAEPLNTDNNSKTQTLPSIESSSYLSLYLKAKIPEPHACALKSTEALLRGQNQPEGGLGTTPGQTFLQEEPAKLLMGLASKSLRRMVYKPATL